MNSHNLSTQSDVPIAGKGRKKKKYHLRLGTCTVTVTGANGERKAQPNRALCKKMHVRLHDHSGCVGSFRKI